MLTISDSIVRDYKEITPYESRKKCEALFKQHSFIVVRDESGFYGVLVPRDCVEKPHTLIIDCLTEKPVLSPEHSVFEALSLMCEHSLPALPVMDGENLFLGPVSFDSLIRFCVESIDSDTTPVTIINRNEDNCTNQVGESMRSQLSHFLFNSLQLIYSAARMLMMDQSVSDDHKILLKSILTNASKIEGIVSSLLKNFGE